MTTARRRLSSGLWVSDKIPTDTISTKTYKMDIFMTFEKKGARGLVER